ncbi:hypothetical protein WJX77_010114 [Trebouxia sp. C0004]
MGAPAYLPSIYEVAEVKIKKVVYKNRIRLKEFFVDFDKLRSGFIFENQFLSGLSMAGLDKHLTASQLQALADAYKTPETNRLSKVDYRRFCEDINTVFTENELEKDPLKEVPAEPSELLDKTRYDFSSKQLPEERETQLESIMNKLREECQIKGIMVKPFFDDAAHDKNSCHMVNHVTVSQFKQGLGVKMGFTSLSQTDIGVLIEKFLDDEYPPGDMINYVAFAHCLNPVTLDYD